jgi:hypothetical protein
MMAEPEDARLTGQTRNLERRLLGADLHVGDNSTQIVLQITGPEGVKQFMKAELSEMIG